MFRTTAVIIASLIVLVVGLHVIAIAYGVVSKSVEIVGVFH